MYRTTQAPGDLDADYVTLSKKLFALDSKLNGNPAKNQVGAWTEPGISDRISHANLGTFRSTYGPTPAIRKSLTIANEEIAELRASLNVILTQDIPAFEEKLHNAGAPWVAGQALPSL